MATSQEETDRLAREARAEAIFRARDERNARLNHPQPDDAEAAPETDAAPPDQERSLVDLIDERMHRLDERSHPQDVR